MQKHNKKGRYARQKRKVKGGICCPFPCPLPVKKDGKLQTTNEELDEIVNNIFASVFNGNICFHTSQVSGMQEGDWGSEVLPTVSEELVCDHLRNQIVHRSMGPGGIHASVLRELTDVIAKIFSIIFDIIAIRRSPRLLEKDNIMPIFKKGTKVDPGNYSSSPLCPKK